MDMHDTSPLTRNNLRYTYIRLRTFHSLQVQSSWNYSHCFAHIQPDARSRSSVNFSLTTRVVRNCFVMKELILCCTSDLLVVLATWLTYVLTHTRNTTSVRNVTCTRCMINTFLTHVSHKPYAWATCTCLQIPRRVLASPSHWFVNLRLSATVCRTVTWHVSCAWAVGL